MIEKKINCNHLPSAFWISVLSIARLNFTSLNPQLGGAFGTHSLWHLYLGEKNHIEISKFFFQEKKTIQSGMKSCFEISFGGICKLHSLLPYLQCRHAFPRNTCLLQTSQKENLNTRVLSNLENEYKKNKTCRFSFYLLHWEKRIGSRNRSFSKSNGNSRNSSYLHTLHLVPRKKIFFVHTLHVDNFIRLLHLRIREREKKEILSAFS
jgi:Cft2 family RNA processing exonuclease